MLQCCKNRCSLRFDQAFFAEHITTVEAAGEEHGAGFPVEVLHSPLTTHVRYRRV